MLAVCLACQRGAPSDRRPPRGLSCVRQSAALLVLSRGSAGAVGAPQLPAGAAGGSLAAGAPQSRAGGPSVSAGSCGSNVPEM